MIPLAIGVGNAILGSLTVVVALIGAVVALALLTRLTRPVLEIDRYAEEILGAAQGITGNLEGAAELARTRELAVSLPARAGAYLSRLQGRFR